MFHHQLKALMSQKFFPAFWMLFYITFSVENTVLFTEVVKIFSIELIASCSGPNRKIIIMSQFWWKLSDLFKLAFLFSETVKWVAKLYHKIMNIVSCKQHKFFSIFVNGISSKSLANKPITKNTSQGMQCFTLHLTVF